MIRLPDDRNIGISGLQGDLLTHGTGDGSSRPSCSPNRLSEEAVAFYEYASFNLHISCDFPITRETKVHHRVANWHELRFHEKAGEMSAETLGNRVAPIAGSNSNSSATSIFRSSRRFSSFRLSFTGILAPANLHCAVSHINVRSESIIVYTVGGHCAATMIVVRAGASNDV
jgi:hypothetical protein